MARIPSVVEVVVLLGLALGVASTGCDGSRTSADSGGSGSSARPTSQPFADGDAGDEGAEEAARSRADAAGPTSRPGLSSFAGKPFTVFRAKEAVTGQTFSLADFRGRIVLLDFWATGASQQYKPAIETVKPIYAKYHDACFDIISICLDPKPEEGRAFIEQARMNWYHVMDNSAHLGKQFDIRALPRMVLLDPNGVAVVDPVRPKALATYLEKVQRETPAKTLAQWTSETPVLVMARAEKEIEAGQYAAALKSLELVANWFPGTPQADAAAKREAEMRADPSIVKKLKRGGEKGSPQQNAANIMTLARKLQESKRYAHARELFKRLIDEFPDSAEATEAREILKTLPD